MRTLTTVPADPNPPEGAMQDLLYLTLVVGFLALSWGFVELCDRLSR